MQQTTDYFKLTVYIAIGYYFVHLAIPHNLDLNLFFWIVLSFLPIYLGIVLLFDPIRIAGWGYKIPMLASVCGFIITIYFCLVGGAHEREDWIRGGGTWLSFYVLISNVLWASYYKWCKDTHKYNNAIEEMIKKLKILKAENPDQVFSILEDEYSPGELLTELENKSQGIEIYVRAYMKGELFALR